MTIEGYTAHCEEPDYFWPPDLAPEPEPTAEEQALQDAVDGTPDWTRAGADPDYRVFFIRRLLEMSQPSISDIARIGIVDLPPVNWQLAAGSQAYRAALIRRLLTQSEPVRMAFRKYGFPTEIDDEF